MSQHQISVVYKPGKPFNNSRIQYSRVFHMIPPAGGAENHHCEPFPCTISTIASLKTTPDKFALENNRTNFPAPRFTNGNANQCHCEQPVRNRISHCALTHTANERKRENLVVDVPKRKPYMNFLPTTVLLPSHSMDMQQA